MIHSRDKAKYMAELDPDATKHLPYDIPEPLANEVYVTCFVDADHAGNKII